ncbi:Vacuolar protein sorting-associated protein [Wickerhamomyces ciferrii]|uniref:Vacuolar protein sorting-associated protein 28 n=1 Tax=Wickerhamomyces ciferrii (strain ATCC 14091 / BCRC 22168 / CBS 111 / JCM 3599 / NBRC 0793 / NRRL Y-1031 F-60-10) TaxID=1206466 RepID=K0KQ42_WICCF|nr:Vacuolar protein sorting-associated protein [Wickerhamomyces ciferrii]CCH43308.1 Vacuolar protein sorting-associated protein [Wickerhamomyces ciferrii]
MSTPSYAPTATQRNPSYNRIKNSSINLDQEVSLFNTVQQREIYESLAELFSIITVLDFIEKAYIKDTLNEDGEDQYTPTVLRLLAQYNTILKNQDVVKEFKSLDHFKKQYGLNCPSATSRIEIGVPATVEHAINVPSTTGSGNGAGGSGNGGIGASSRAVAEATGNFITCMDALKLNYKAKDQLHPLLSDLMTSVNKVSGNKEFDGRSKLIEWLIKINKLNINEEISEDDTRQLLFDLDNAYKGFYTMLE